LAIRIDGEPGSLTFKKSYGIIVNCIMPGFVITRITIPALVYLVPKQYITCMKTTRKGFDTCFDDTEGKTNEGLECSIDNVYFRKPVDYADESTKWMVEDSAELFAEAFGQNA
jgi:hypothetical protein